MDYASQKATSTPSLTSLPVDVVYEIFSYLTPLDLLHICWTSRELRRVMMSKESVTVWKSARRVRNDVPACRPGVSEPQWAYLLFGPSTCQLCGNDAPEGVSLQLQLPRRACRSCLEANTITEHDIPKHFPEAGGDTAEYLPSVVLSPRKKGLRWIDDVRDVVSQLTRLQADVETGKDGAQQALDNYQTSRRTFVLDCHKSITAGELWLHRDAVMGRSLILVESA